MLWLAFGIIIVLAGTWWFLHRDPNIPIEPFEGYLSPADGIVADIIAVRGPRVKIPKHWHGITAFLEDAPWAHTIIVIMMRPEHIHTQRSPVAGTIVSVDHKRGTLANAVFGDWRKATVENEHVAFSIKGERPCKVYAIAGLLARRIKPRVERRQRVAQGERICSIAFGSQVAIVLPQSEIQVSIGDRAHVGRTRLAA